MFVKIKVAEDTKDTVLYVDPTQFIAIIPMKTTYDRETGEKVEMCRLYFSLKCYYPVLETAESLIKRLEAEVVDEAVKP